jgi:hypothetical protein
MSPEPEQEQELAPYAMSDVFESGFKTGRVPALDGANFVEWLDLVKTVLLSKGL